MKYVRGICVIVSLSAISVLFGSSTVHANIHDFYDITAEEIRSLAEAQKGESEEIDFLFRIYSMDRNAVLRYRTGDDLSPMIQPLFSWCVFMCNSNYKSLGYLSVYFANGEWQVGDFVYTEEGDTIKKNISPEFMPEKNGNKYVAMDSTYDFIAIPDGEETKLLPILDYHDYPYIAQTFPPDKKDSRGLYSASDVMPTFARIIRGEMQITPNLNINGNWYLDGAYYPAEYSADSRQNITVTAELININRFRDNADWWVVLESDDRLYYLNPSMQWVTAQVPVAQAPVQQVVGFPIYSGTLPVGTYKLYVGLDLTQDGVINEPLFWNMVTITVR